jgi:hypothetical protein
VTISGTNFGSSQGSSTVKFNGTTATASSWSSTQIVVTVPGGTTTGAVLVNVNSVNSNGYNFYGGTSAYLNSFSPITGSVGTSVTISGGNFGSTQGSSTVKFNGTTATPTSWGDNQIVAPVPSGTTTGALIVHVGGVGTNGINFYGGASPYLTSISPSLGSVETLVTVNGGNFGSTQGSSTVKFNGTTATPTSWGDNQIVAPVPSGATSGNVIVNVGGTGSNGINFTGATSPYITNLSPHMGPAGTSITITGSNFGSTQGSSTVKFNGITATPTNWSATQIITPVPSGTTTGPVLITVGGAGSNGYNFYGGSSAYLGGVSPGSGSVGTSVTITGGNFGSTQGSSTVTFNGTAGTPTSWSDTQIVVPVPSGATTGNVIVTVSGTGTNGQAFTVSPLITSVAPSTGSAGTSVTIAGSNFGATQGSSTVQINGASASVTSWSSASIAAAVPAGATPLGYVYVTVGGLTSNGEAFHVTPTISSIDPSLISSGTPVTVAGSAFGATQGTSTVSFNGVAGTPTSWGNTQVVVPVPSGATSGNLTVTVGGQTSNGTAFTIVDPPGITSSVFPAANGSGWHNMNVTVTFTCTAGDLALASCSDPEAVTSEGLDFLATGRAEDVNGNAASTTVTLDIDKTQPTLTITSPENGDSTSSSSITVTGTLSDTLSGTSGVTCNGTATSLSSGSFSCDVSLNVGLNLLVIRGTDVAGNVSAANFHITRTGSLGTPTTLQITPTGVNMVVGETQQFTVVDQDGRPRPDATWAVDDTDIATIPDEDTPELTAVDVGEVTLTATIGSASAEVEINVLSGTSLPDGTVRWAAPTAAGQSPQQIVHARMAAGAPHFYSIEGSVAGDGVRALTADGRQLWVKQFASIVQAWPDANGGVLLQTATQLVSLDPLTGAQLWAYEALGLQSRNLAIGHDGTIFDHQRHFGSGSNFSNIVSSHQSLLVALDGGVGVPRASYQVPPSTYFSSNCSGSSISSGPSGNFASQPSIAPDGTALMMFRIDHRVTLGCAPNTHDKTLSLLKMTPDGSVTITEIEQINWVEGQGGPGGVPDIWYTSVIPDGQGGVLNFWWRTEPDEFHVGRVSSAGVSDFTLPFTDSAPEEMVLGQDGIAYAANGGEIIAFDISSGNVVWDYDPDGGIHLIASTADGGLVAKVNGEGNVQTVVRFDSEGGATFDEWTGENLQYDVSGFWLGRLVSTDTLQVLVAPTVILSDAVWYSPDQGGALASVSLLSVTGASKTGPNQAAISDVLLRIQNALPSFPACNNWLQGPGQSGGSFIQDLRSNSFFGHGTVKLDGELYHDGGAFTGTHNRDLSAIGGLLPNMVITVNDIGPFFRSYRDNKINRPYAWGPRKYPGASEQARNLIMIHEVAHGVGKVNFLPDLADGDAGGANDLAVDMNCRALIDGPIIENLSPNTGPVATQVTITGKNFGSEQQNSTVKFHNGVVVTPTTWTDTQIVVSVPAGAQTGNVTVTVGGGQTGQSATKNFGVQ